MTKINIDCKHKWKIIEEQICSSSKLFFKSRDHYHNFVLQCSVCGDLKNHMIGMGERYKKIIQNGQRKKV